MSKCRYLPFGKSGRNFFLWFIDHNFFHTLSFDNLISLRVLPFFVGSSALSKINKLFEVHLTLFLTVYWAVKFLFPQTLCKLICNQFNYISLETSKAFYFQFKAFTFSREKGIYSIYCSIVIFEHQLDLWNIKWAS